MMYAGSLDEEVQAQDAGLGPQHVLSGRMVPA
jgi:hypothetical protein